MLTHVLVIAFVLIVVLVVSVGVIRDIERTNTRRRLLERREELIWRLANISVLLERCVGAEYDELLECKLKLINELEALDEIR